MRSAATSDLTVASLIGRSGSSTFRLSTTAVLMSLAGSCFSSESAPRPFHHGIRRRGGTIFRAALPSNERQVQADTGRAVDEYLAVLDDAAFGAATEVTPKFISPADPAARWTGAHGGQAFFAYSTNYLVDVENAVIIDVEATTAIRQAEVLAAKRMIERSLERFDLYPSRLLGDSAYGSA